MSSKLANMQANQQDLQEDCNSRSTNSSEKTRSSTNIELNILSRPKRAIHSKKFELTAELLKNLQNMPEDDDSDDEEFMPEKFAKKTKQAESKEEEEVDDDDQGESDEENSNSSDESNSSYETSADENDDKQENLKQNVQIKSNKNNSQNDSKFLDTNEPIYLNDSETDQSRKEIGKLNNESFSEKKKRGRKKKSDVSLSSNKTEKKESKTKSKKRKTKKLKRNNFESDEETQKILNSFKKTSLKIKKPIVNNSKQNKMSKSQQKPVNNSINELNDTLAVRQQQSNSGPYVRKITQKKQINETSQIEIPMFIIGHQHNNEEGQDFNSATDPKLIVRKDKPNSIVDFESPWTCTLCSMKPHNPNGMGDLFGPYRVSKNLEEDSIDELDEKLESNFMEVWLHEGCIVWSPNIYIKNNRLYGLSALLRTAFESKCISCKKPGASLVCHRHSCNKAFHYPCAIKNESNKIECSFKQENFTILCKNHSN